MGHQDIVSQETIRRIAIDLAVYLLGLEIDPDSLELLDTEQQRIEDRRADLVVRLRERPSGEPFLLHIEIQSHNEPLMPWRMLRYLTDVQMRHPGQRLRQYLIYIGGEPLRMADRIEQPELSYRYGLLDMRRVDCERLLAQDNPDALVLAILCDFRGRDPQGVVNEIFRRLQAHLGDNPKRLREYIDMIEVLSENRDLKTQIKEAEAMLTQIDVKRLPSYELGLEKGWKDGMEVGLERGLAYGMDKGMEKGVKQGLEQGMEQGRVKLLLRLLRVKFGPLAPELEARVQAAGGEQIELWAERILTAQSLDAMFG